MPLDLHVLGLSLAFILSQDQTLRCCIFFFSLFSLLSRRSRLLPPRRPSPGTATPKFIALFPGVQRIVTWTRLRFLSLSLTVSFVCRNHFNDLCPSCANGSLPGLDPRFSRLRLQRYYKKPIRSKLFPIFFSSFFTKIPEHPLAQHLTPQIFYAVKHIFASSYGLANNKTREFLCYAISLRPKTAQNSVLASNLGII